MIRYPGGKNKLKNIIISKFPSVRHYCEPFFGTGSVGVEFLKTHKIDKFWINDKDYGIYSIWQSIIDFPNELKEKINKFIPSVEYFDRFKYSLLNLKEDIVETAFKKIAIHQLSYSGLGLKSGGPLGGREQKSAYKIDCRWSPKYICSKIDLLSKLLSEVICTNEDFFSLNLEDYFIYLDPPYFIKGQDLYYCGIFDHLKLAEKLNDRDNWILSYDDCPEIKNLYSWANIEEINVNYTIKNSRNKKELLIWK